MVVQHTEIELLHRRTLLSGIRSLKESNILTDVTLVVEGMKFRAHKVILASCSSYFRALFAGELLESEKEVIHIHDLTCAGFQVVLEFIYTSNVHINDNNVLEILSCASYTQVLPLMSACEDFLKINLDTENCCDIAIIAENYSLFDLKKVVLHYLCVNLFAIAKKKDFYRLTPKHIEYIVASGLPVDVEEIKLLEFILNWFLNETYLELNKKLDLAENILQHIHFYEIIPADLDSLLRTLFSYGNGVLKNWHSLYRTVTKISQRPGNTPRLDLLGNLFNTRGMELALIRVGGFRMTGLTNDISFSFQDEKVWNHLTTIPHVDQCNFGTAVLNNELYIIGGCYNQSLQEVIHHFGFKYNPQTNLWVKIDSMKYDRCRFTLNVIGTKLFAIAGATDNHEYEATHTAECYDIKDDSWEFIESLPESKQQHAAVAFGNKLYVSGGLHKDHVVSSMYVYDSTKNSWTSCSPLLTPRADHFMIVYNFKIYVCGGWRDYGNSREQKVQITTIDAYDLITNTWSFVTHVPTPRYYTSVVALDSSIYFIGGFRTERTFHKDTVEIEQYDITKDKWTVGEKEPQHFWEHSSAVMYVPKYRN